MPVTFSPAPAFIAANNRINDTGFQYDAAGNLTEVPSAPGGAPQSFTYDAECHLTDFNGVASYTYDGEGRRVLKVIGSERSVFVYDVLGQLVAEYVTGGTPTVGGRSYLTADHLGSTRVVTSASGTVIARHDYLPFGEQIGAKINKRPSIPGYDQEDGIKQKFTAKERDAESGLDYFGIRYFGSSMGRFVSPDPVGGHTQDPQTFNRYAYVRNNPLTLTDPTGLDFYLQCQTSDHSGCTQVQTDPNNNKSTQWVQADKNGTATVVTSDSIRVGDNTATVSENGVQINGNNQGIYFDNAASHTTDTNGGDVNNNPIDLAGSGALKDFDFHINGNGNGTVLTSGEWSYHGSLNDARALLYQRGSSTIPFEDVRAGFGLGTHPFSTQHRFRGSGCSFWSCPNSPHLSVPYDPGTSSYAARVAQEPKANVPSSGGFHVDAHADWIGHAKDVNK